MKPGLRRFFFFAYTIFFVALTPLLILVSLGYDINFEDWELTPTLKVEVKSLPRSSEVFYSNQKVFDTPGEAKVLGDKIVDISIRARGFVEEEFQLWSKQRKNEAVSIDSLAMLPLESEVLENFDDQKAITLFSDGFVLLKQNQEYFVSSFSFGGVESQINKVVNIEKKP
ncbi:hypothetical protein HC766_03435 [Candidatus Gracilibacteria bacterium]|nr:hypothetical protein [Candidatus Gracilibacteria bacterium]